MGDKRITLDGDIKSPNHQMKVHLSMIAFEEDNAHIIYCPALDLSGYGSDEKEAMKSFTHCFGEFISYTQHKKTFHSELVRLGWKVNEKKCTAPPMSELLSNNENFSRIFDKHSFRKFDKSVEMPILC